MRFAADSSALVSLYCPNNKTEGLTSFLAEDQKCISVSELAQVEVLNVLLRQSTETPARQFQSDLVEGIRLKLETVDWPDAFQQAESLARRFSRALRPGGHDLVLVAAALTMGASWFLSFDRASHQRTLAAAAGLKVWPPLDKEERGLARHAATK